MSFTDWDIGGSGSSWSVTLEDPDGVFSSKFVRLYAGSNYGHAYLYRTISISNPDADLFILKFDYRLSGGNGRVFIDGEQVADLHGSSDVTTVQLMVSSKVSGKSSITLKFEAVGTYYTSCNFDVDNIKLLTGEEL